MTYRPQGHRWTSGRKAEIARKVLAGTIAAAAAALEHGLAIEEIDRWVELYRQFGELGLRQTDIGKIRRAVASA